jgi:hypothetical protein
MVGGTRPSLNTQLLFRHSFLDSKTITAVVQKCSSVIGTDSMLQVGRSWIRFPMSLHVSIDLILPAALWPWGRLSL